MAGDSKPGVRRELMDGQICFANPAFTDAIWNRYLIDENWFGSADGLTLSVSIRDSSRSIGGSFRQTPANSSGFRKLRACILKVRPEREPCLGWVTRQKQFSKNPLNARKPMKSETVDIQQIFQNRRQYCVPFYQRAYVWTLRDQWEQLWDDIRVKAEVRINKEKVTPHFLGAVVLEPQPLDGLVGVNVLHIIDGQQRLTTLQFVLSALQITFRRAGGSNLMSVVNECVRNDKPENMKNAAVEVFKVWPTFRDQEDFTLALEAQNLDELRGRFPGNFTQSATLKKVGVDHPPALAALWYFTHCFASWIAEDPEKTGDREEALVLAILRDLKIVSILLDPEDDAQVIFETLNGRGAQLHATDLIRNYLFMRADRDGPNSQTLYDKLWSPFETAYWSEQQRRGRMNKPRLEWLIHATLQAELHEEIDLSRLYFEYRRFATSLPAEKQLLTLTKYAQHYKELIAGVGEMPIARFGRRIAPYDITTLHPLALMISTSTATDAEKSEMFGDLVSFLVRRAICGLTSKNYNNVFITTLRQLHSTGANPVALRDLMTKATGDATRWPQDAEFRSACLSAPLYFGRVDTPKIRAILTELESFLRTTGSSEEPVPPDLSQLDVDHIMPRSWMNYWPLIDGSSVTNGETDAVEQLSRSGMPLNDQQKLINDRQASISTLGNLSLLNLKVNRAAQNFEFLKKRDLLIANTNLSLNIPLIPLQAWNEASIAERGERLADAALKIWLGPRH
jgi:hypothetical protein